MKSIKKKVKSFLTKLYIWSKERTWGGQKYLYVGNNSPNLLVVFPGFGVDDHRLYNFVKSFWSLKFDKLYLLDTYAYRGSYFWYEDGTDRPEESVTKFLAWFKQRKKYNRVIMVGSSKGGSCAVYYGLKCGANEIYAGACQYFIGNYLNIPIHKKIFFSMMGDNAGDKEKEILNNKLQNLIFSHVNLSATINLLYSKDEEEKTFQTDMYFLIEDLKKNGYSVSEKVETFTKHADIGIYFPGFVLDRINDNK